MMLINFPLIKSQKSERLGSGHWSSKSNNSGQAAVEYMLLIFVSVTFVVTIALSVFQPLGQFVDSLNRQYIQCLLETGELPQLSSSNESTVCFEELPRFAALDANGNPIPQDGSSSRSSGEKNNTVANREGSSTNSAGGGRSVRVTRVGGGVGVSRGNASPEGGSDKTTVIAVDQSFDEGLGFTASASSASGRSRARKTRKIAIASLTDYEKRKLERTLEKSQKLPAGDNEGFTQTQKKKIIVKPPPPPKSKDDLKIDLGYGQYIKMLLLIIFILFVIIVFGSQAFQLSKNWGNN